MEYRRGVAVYGVVVRVLAMVGVVLRWVQVLVEGCPHCGRTVCLVWWTGGEL